MRPHELLSAIAEHAGGRAVSPLAIYVHVPFCTSKCHFCDWVVDVPVERLRAGRDARSAYVTALCDQITFYGPQLTRLGYRPEVMYWGGGTPTRLSAGELHAIRDALVAAFELAGLRQWSVETTPRELSRETAATLRELGVDRVSVGVQSFDAEQLRRSGRAHTAEDAVAAIGNLRTEGFENFNVDLIASFPGEQPEQLRRTLRRAVDLAPPHVSVYPYRATPKTVMALQLERHVRTAATAERMVADYEIAMEVLGDAGYLEYCHGYWVREAAHEDQDGNYKYDLAGDKIGFGSGAESIVGQHLLWNQNTEYRRFLAAPRAFSFVRRFSVDEPERLAALVGGALMTRDGVVYERFARLTGVDFPELRETPYLRRWLDVLADCGATFVETPVSLRLDRATIHRAYIRHLVRSLTAGVEAVRA